MSSGDKKGSCREGTEDGVDDDQGWLKEGFHHEPGTREGLGTKEKSNVVFRIPTRGCPLPPLLTNILSFN